MTLRTEALEAVHALAVFLIDYACTDDASEALNVEDARDYHSLCERLEEAARYERMYSALVMRDDDAAQNEYDALTLDYLMTEEQYMTLEAFFETHLEYIDAQENVEKFCYELR
jgi:hypothetical protein